MSVRRLLPCAAIRRRSCAVRTVSAARMPGTLLAERLCQSRDRQSTSLGTTGAALRTRDSEIQRRRHHGRRLRRQMTVAAARQSVAASNLANVDTPGYKAQEVDFDRRARTQLQAARTWLTTNRRHLAASPCSDPATVGKRGRAAGAPRRQHRAARSRTAQHDPRRRRLQRRADRARREVPAGALRHQRGHGNHVDA